MKNPITTMNTTLTPITTMVIMVNQITMMVTMMDPITTIITILIVSKYNSFPFFNPIMIFFSACYCNYDLIHNGRGACEQEHACPGGGSGRWCYIDGGSECPDARPSTSGAPWYWTCTGCPAPAAIGAPPERSSGISKTNNFKQGQGVQSGYNRKRKTYCKTRTGWREC